MKTPFASPFSRSLYRSIRNLDENQLQRRRKQLEKTAQNLLKQKEKILKQIHAVQSKERSYQFAKKNYEHMVNTVTRKIQYHETKRLSERQKELEAFSLEATHPPSQDGMEI